MNPFINFSILFLVLLSIIAPSHSAKSTATSFCKCICFNNSTIIALNPPPSSTSTSSLHNLDIRSPHAGPVETDDMTSSTQDDGETSPSRPRHKLTCADCTRAFCLDYNLPICKDAREEDIFTTCFQRDSLKDETVVVIFIFATAGLLAWAVVKPWVDKLRERNTFTPLGQHDPGQGGGAGSGRSNTSARKPKAHRGNELRDESARSINRDRGLDRDGDDGEVFTVGSNEEELHADQDAVDIAADVPSGSGSNTKFRP